MTQKRPTIETRPNLHLPMESRLRFPRNQGRRAAVFLDRDGVLNEEVGNVWQASQLAVLDGVPEALRQLQEEFYLIVVTNQSGIARGVFTEHDLLAIHTELTDHLESAGVVLDALYYCPHLPEGSVQQYAVVCDCRKPKPGMLLRAQAEWDLQLSQSFMVGDTSRDIEAGGAAGVTSIQVAVPDVQSSQGRLLADDLLSAVQLIQSRESEPRVI